MIIKLSGSMIKTYVSYKRYKKINNFNHGTNVNFFKT